MHKVFLPFVLLALPWVVSAQQPGSTVVQVVEPRPLPPPALVVRRGSKSVPLKLAKLAVRATIVGHLAETEMTMTFHNPNNRVLEGDLYFPLPAGSTVSGYALDIGGRMVDGVVVGKHKARQVFEKEVRKGVDPGLVEWTQGRNFKTRVFPIPARGSRTIRVSYVAEVLSLRGQATYRLPLGFKSKVGAFSLRVEVVKAVTKPLIVSGGPKGLAFTPLRDSFIAEAKLTNARLHRDLRVALPNIQQRPVRLETSPDGKVHFAIRDVVAHNGASPANRPRRITLYWDASLSRAKASHKAEIALLERYLDELGRQRLTVQLVVFRNAAQQHRNFVLPGQRAALLKVLRHTPYDGATQLGDLKRSGPRPDLVLLFSDGLSNFGKEDPPDLGAPIYAVNSSAGANHAMLRYLALRSGGAYLDLNRIDVPQAASSIGAETFSFISATATGVRPGSVYPKLRMPVRGAFTLAGQLNGKTATVTLNYGIGTRILHSRTYTLRRKEAVRGDLLRRQWAQLKLDDLLIFPRRNAKAIAALGREHSIVTPGTSLIVLERLDQYVEHQIRPPHSWPEMRARYDKAQKQRAVAVRRQKASKLAHVLALWKRHKAWWKKRFKAPKQVRARPAKAEALEEDSAPDMARGSGGLGVAPAPRSAPHRRMRRRDSAESEARVSKKAKPVAATGPTIAIKPWNPKTPYLAALAAAPPSRRYAVYLRQRKQHGSAPAFYLDCATAFRKAKRTRLALRVLSNLAELELENPALLRVLAHQLTQTGELDLAIATFARVLALRPEEPQSYRDLALVLERRAHKNRRGALADYRRALELLAQVVMKRWDRFEEIELIALTELNNILPRARKLGLRKLPIDKRLVQRLDMDIRIVMVWDADQTDMDLHVIEPTGEEAYYGHNLTQIGGRVSRDFTNGYGPEVYAVRRALRGRYRIRTKYFGSSAAKLTGAVTLQVHIYTNYGRANQRRKSLTLRLTRSKEEFEIGSIRF